MSQFEYKVVPAPKKGLKAKGLKTAEDRFANALQATMNELGADGWEYQRTDTLPNEERSGLTGRVTTFQNMLVFRRTLYAAAPQDTAEQRVTATIAPVVSEPSKLAARPLTEDPARPEPHVAAE